MGSLGLEILAMKIPVVTNKAMGKAKRGRDIQIIWHGRKILEEIPTNTITTYVSDCGRLWTKMDGKEEIQQEIPGFVKYQKRIQSQGWPTF